MNVDPRKAFVADMPDSVRRYLGDAMICRAVQSIDGLSRDGLAPGLHWNEFLPFLEARAMAHLTRAEYPIALHKFWDEVWGAANLDGWTIQSIDQIGNDLVGPVTSWRDHNQVVNFTRGRFTLFTLVGLTEESTMIGIALDSEDQEGLLEGEQERFPEPWKWETEEVDHYMMASWAFPITSEEFSWNDMIKSRDESLHIVRNAVPTLVGSSSA